MENQNGTIVNAIILQMISKAAETSSLGRMAADNVPYWFTEKYRKANPFYPSGDKYYGDLTKEQKRNVDDWDAQERIRIFRLYVNYLAAFCEPITFNFSEFPPF